MAEVDFVKPEVKAEIVPSNGRPPDMMSLLHLALSNNAAIDVIERLVALRKDEMARQAEQEFNEAMNAAQAEIQRIVPNRENTQTHSWFADYSKMDEVLRPIYLRHGFSLSFDCGQPTTPNTVRAYCFVSHRGGHTRKYQSSDMPLPTIGPQGKPVMTETHGTGAAMSYAMRYLLKYIFNVAIGKDDTDGNLGMERTPDFLALIKEAKDLAELEKYSKQAVAEAYKAKAPTAAKIFMEARQKREAELSKPKQEEGPL